MHMAVWQKSSYSGDATNCLNVAAAGSGLFRLRESDDPDTVLAVAPATLRALLRVTASRSWPSPRPAPSSAGPNPRSGSRSAGGSG
ncbi:DUF397 domain-containing protein [Streptomyces sp. NPDC037389]|uniref:DUF397 domain-containing protein n=1 Tax=Streptomyces sp. NPDC037389 TaxID=3155369 RepID=UPI0033FEBEE6